MRRTYWAAVSLLGLYMTYNVAVTFWPVDQPLTIWAVIASLAYAVQCALIALSPPTGE